MGSGMPFRSPQHGALTGGAQGWFSREKFLTDEKKMKKRAKGRAKPEQKREERRKQAKKQKQGCHGSE